MGDLLQNHLFQVLLILGAPFLLILWVIPMWFVCRKAGFSPWLTMLNCIPFGTPILLYLLAFADWRPDHEHEAQPIREVQSPQRMRGPQLVVR